MFKLQPGKPGDADAAARLIAETDVDLFRYLAGGRLEAWMKIAASEWGRRRGVYNFKMAEVVRRDDDDDIIGLMVSYSADTHAKIDWEGVGSAAKVAPSVPKRVRDASQMAGYLFPAIPPDAWYLQNIAVAPEARGTGLGRFLVQAVCDRARTAGCRSLHLDVDSTIPAVEFYRRLGFEVLVETRVPSIPGANLHYRMVLSLGSTTSGARRRSTTK